MAKQSVSFVERHLEKIVVGAAGFVALSMAVLYVVGNPNGIDAGGATVGPGDIGARLKDDAKRVYQSILAAKPEKTQLPDYVAEVEQSRPLQIDRSLTPRFAVAMTPLNPVPPPVSRIDITGKNRLATILPPGKPVVFQGRCRAMLVPPGALSGLPSGGLVAPGNEASPLYDASSATDLTWVTVAAPVFRNKQVDEFNAAGYIPGRTAILIARVRMERQRLEPDGSWSEPPQEVRTYTKYTPFNPPEVKLTEDETGSISLDPETTKRLEALHGSLKTPDVQAAMWRPPLAPYLDITEWPPAGTPAIEAISWSDWPGAEAPGSQFRGEALTTETPRERTPKRDTVRPERQPRTPTGSPDDRARATSNAFRNLREAKKAVDANDWETADGLLAEILKDGTKLPTSVISQAEGLKEKVDAARAMAEEKAAKEQQEREARAAGTLEVDVEPLWVHDLTAQPGKTYRYRVRIDIFNMYSLFPRDLSEPRDAEKVLLGSDWSDWSTPVAVRPDTYFFFMGGTKEGDVGTATIDLYKWAGGEWHLVKKKFEIGQRIACEDRKAGTIDTQWAVADVDPNAKRPARTSVNRDGSFNVKADETVQVLVVASVDGQVAERTNLDDRNSPELSELKKETGKGR